MAIKRDAASVKTDITTLLRREGNGWVDMYAQNRAKRRVGGVWTDLLPAAPSGELTVSFDVSEAFVVYTCDDPDEPPFVCATVKTLTTSSITASSSGGSGIGPTYAWTYVSGDMGFIPSAPASATTDWTINVPQNVTKNAVWRCTVTRGSDTVYADVLVTADYIRTGGGIEA